MEAFAKIFDILKPVTIFAKIFVLNILLGSKYTSNSNVKNIIMIRVIVTETGFEPTII